MKLKRALLFTFIFLASCLPGNAHEIECVCNIAGSRQITLIVVVTSQDLQHSHNQDYVAAWQMNLEQNLQQYQLTPNQLQQVIQQVWRRLLLYFSN